MAAYGFSPRSQYSRTVSEMLRLRTASYFLSLESPIISTIFVGQVAS